MRMLALALLLLFCVPLAAFAATTSPERGHAIEVFKENQLEALPLLEAELKKTPDDPAILEMLAVSLIAQTATLPPAEQPAINKRARSLLMKSRDLGNTSNLSGILLRGINEDGSTSNFSDNPAIDAAMREGEASFAKQNFTDAIKHYSEALRLDPHHYEAALFIGDSYFRMEQWDKAAAGYEKAIAIDPDRETAYRYYADMLMKQGEMQRARSFAIKAVVADPYNETSWVGLKQWAQLANVEIKDPAFDIPVEIKGKDAQLKLDLNGKPDESKAWLAYLSTRADWLNHGLFQKHFPKESTYRHSAAEEVAALGDAAKSWRQRSSKASNAELDLVDALDKKDLLTAYVFLRNADQGIAADYAAYRARNRDKLEKFISDYMVPSV